MIKKSSLIVIIHLHKYVQNRDVHIYVGLIIFSVQQYY